MYTSITVWFHNRDRSCQMVALYTRRVRQF